MARYSAETKLSPEDAIEKAMSYFGEGGLGLEADEQGPCCVYFEGGGGHVRITVSAGKTRTAVEVETREWDHHIKRFLRKIA